MTETWKIRESKREKLIKKLLIKIYTENTRQRIYERINTKKFLNHIN